MFDILENAVRVLVKHFDEDYDAQIGLNFQADINNEIIYFTIVESIEDEEAFLLNLYNEFPFSPNLNSFLWSILHEIGHLQTDDDAEDDFEMRKALMSKNCVLPQRERIQQYFMLSSEQCATDWAAYISYSHKNFLRQWWETIWTPAFNKFIIDNNVER